MALPRIGCDLTNKMRNGVFEAATLSAEQILSPHLNTYVICLCVCVCVSTRRSFCKWCEIIKMILWMLSKKLIVDFISSGRKKNKTKLGKLLVRN